MRDVDEAIGRVRQAQYQGVVLSEDELVQAADLLGAHLDRADARDAAAAVMHWLGAPEQVRAGAPDEFTAVPPAPVTAIPPAPVTAVAPGGGERRFSAADLTRIVGATVLAVLAVTLWFVMAPDAVADRTDDVAAALADYQGNDARTNGAAQQQVVNGWVAKDLLTIVAEQTNESARADRRGADRLAAEAALGVVALALALATRPSGRRAG